MKYILVRQHRGDVTIDTPFIFSNDVVHSAMYKYVRLMFRMDHEFYGKLECIGAGFIQINANGVKCSGESVSLGIRSRPYRDSAAIENIDYFQINLP